jgi:hypothetical protein
LADRCEVQVAYAIGVAHPVSVFVETFGTHKIDEPLIADLLRVHFDLRPAAIIHNLNLRRPIYQQTAASATRPPGSRSAVGEDGQGRGAAQRWRPERRRRPGTRTAHRVAVAVRNGLRKRASRERCPFLRRTLCSYSDTISTMLATL